MINKFEKLLSSLVEHDIQIELEGESNLRIKKNVSDIPAIILKDLKEHKKELIEYLLSKKIESIKNVYNQIPLVDKKESYTLSSAQKRLYFLQSLSPDSASYNIQHYQFCNENLDRQKLESSLHKLISRHEILRTCFVQENRNVVQKIYEQVEFSTLYYECNDAKEATELIKKSIKAFDLSKPPLFRSVLIKLKDQYLWMVDIHHIISDGTSQQILISDMASIYQGIELPELKIAYKDFSEWQNELKENGELVRQQQYWRHKLRGELPVLNLPTDYARPSVFSFEGDVHHFKIGKKRTEQLKALADYYRGSLQMSLMTILNILFFKYTKQEDIIIGCSITGRSHNELQGMVGMFVNVLPMRCEPNDKKSFPSFFQEVITTSLEAYDNQDVQFDDLVDELKVGRDISRNPVFDVELVVQNFERADVKVENNVFNGAPTIDSAYFDVKHSTSKFDLTFFASEFDEEIRIDIEYYTGIFKASTIVRIADHFNEILNQVLDNTNILLADINLLSEDEQRRLNEFNKTAVEYPSKRNVHSLFTNQCSLTPGKIAVSDINGSYTYLEVEEKSNRIANFLKSGLNIPLESYVGILQTKNKEVVPSILGVLKSGGAYLTLDSELPEERLLYMLKDADVNYLLVEKKLVGLANRLQWRSGIKYIICIDSEHIYSEHGGLINNLMSKDLWEYVGDTAVDSITAGGWLSSYTGDPISMLEMEEYSGNAYKKLKNLLHKDMKVLEIGCSSGLTMFQIAPEVGTYVGTDLSSSILEYTRKVADDNGYDNIVLSCIAANEIDKLQGNNFDLIILNSVVQSFEDHNYLRGVLEKSLGLLKNKGHIFIGDIMDEDKRQSLISDLEAFKRADTLNQFRTKTDWSSELFVSRNYFTDLIADSIGIMDAEFSEKIHTIENELTRFRYDSLLYIDKQARKEIGIKTKYQYDVKNINKHKDNTPQVRVEIHNLCYLIYTSGSTGNPKGVMVEHGSLLNYLNWARFTYSNEQNISLDFGLFTSLSFDLTITSIYLPLISGGTLKIVDSSLDVGTILKNYFESDLKFIKLTPAHITLLKGLGIERTGIQVAVVGGESLTKSHIETLKKINPHMQIFNEYGPTESTVGCIVSDKISKKGDIPIGKPIANTQIYIVNDHKELQPIGMIGEICIGGSGLARGYWNKSELTKEKFIQNPFNKADRIYKTGDLGRWQEDGNIEFIGRRDDQVKIRGYRIELSEIETALLNHEQIEAVVVVVKKNVEDETELVAYITASKKQNASTLHLYLKENLPEYMIPAHYVQLDKMPLTSNGKIDKKSLPDPSGLGLRGGMQYVAPRNKLEEKLVKIWEEILQRENIGVNDTFFALGGHSLKTVRLSNEYQKELDVKVSLKDLFEYTTISAQANFIQSLRKAVYIQIEKIKEQKNYAISDAQQRLWVLSQFEAVSMAYHMSSSVYLNEEVDIECFKSAIYATIDRHEILRTVFKADANGEIKQWVLTNKELDFKIEYKDFKEERNKQERIQSYVKEDSLKMFDLETGPLLRGSLIRLEEKEYLFYLSMHHIITDGWSMDVLSKDILAYYKAYKTQEKPTLKPLRIQYKDYSAWQLAQLEEELFKDHSSYWREKFKGEIPYLDLPSGKKRPVLKTSNGHSLQFYVDAVTTNNLRKYSEENGGSLFIGLLAAWNILMYRYTGQKDIIIGTPTAGREHPDLENQIGFYVNMLPLRNVVNPTDNFHELFSRVKQSTLADYTHQMYPFDRLVNELSLTRDTSRSALFDIMFALQNTRDNTKEQDTIELRQDDPIAIDIVDQGYVPAKFDMDISVTEEDNKLSVQFIYNPDVYDQELAVSLITHYKKLLSELLNQPEKQIGQVEYLSPIEKEELLITFNNTDATYPAFTIVDLFEAQAATTPDSIAVVFEGTELSYRELNARSNQLAFYLKENYQIGSDDLVAVKQERTEWMIISVLAILKSGGAYVPIDPSYPQERIDYIENDTKCKVCIDGFELSKFKKDQQKYSTDNLSLKINSGDLAYIIYTSGSTGYPKGVMIEHKNVYSFIKWSHDEFSISEFDTALFTTSLNFDLSVFEIFHTLTTGKELKVLKDGLSISKNLPKNKKVLINTVPSVVGALLEEGMSFEPVSVLNMAGEPIPTHYKTELQGKVREIRNLYGPSEDTTYSTLIRVDKDQRNLIGKPISNTQVYILNEEGQLQSKGVTGEICIGGSGLARGYLNQEALTVEKFVKNPFKNDERMYKTGDLGRWLPDGNIEFLGRKDNQIKLRGYRIELGEIEHALQSHKEIEDAVVVVNENGNNEKELIAYITSKELQNTSELRSYLKELIPPFMLPSYYIQLEKLPLTSNGKVDRKSLPNPGSIGLSTEVEYVAPRNELERKLVVLWEKVLQRSNVGVNDDFFALGGHSLKAVKILAEYNKTFGIQLSLQDIFMKTQLCSHAELIDIRNWVKKDMENKALEVEDVETFNF